MPRAAWIVLCIVGIAIVVSAALLVLVPGPGGGPAQFVSENVQVLRPPVNGTVLKNFTAVGEARGTWDFEASFPVQVRDPENNLVGQGIAQAEADWMTTGWVPFTAPVTVENYSGPATLIFMKDNPSGLPENEDAVEFPIVIGP